MFNISWVEVALGPATTIFVAPLGVLAFLQTATRRQGETREKNITKALSHAHTDQAGSSTSTSSIVESSIWALVGLWLSPEYKPPKHVQGYPEC